MENCLFCKFVSGEIPVNKVFENDDFIVIRDIAPEAKNHFLAIPKKHYKLLAEMTDDDAANRDKPRGRRLSNRSAPSYPCPFG